LPLLFLGGNTNYMENKSKAWPIIFISQKIMFHIKGIFILLSLTTSNIIFAQKDTSSFKFKSKIEFMIVPLLAYNSVHLGYSWQQKPNIENVILASSTVSVPGISSIKVQFNRNILVKEIKKTKLYFPLWASVRRMNTIGEDGRSAHLFTSIGVGFGAKLMCKTIEKWRCEAGFGVTPALVGNKDYLPLYQVTNFDIEKKYAKILPAFRLNIRYLIGL
jgi:hypothetical protein